MSGINEITKDYLNKINNIIKDKPDYIKGFSNYMTDSSIRTKYNYINHIIAFIDWLGKDNISDLQFDDFNNYITHITYKEDGSKTSSSYQINIYSSLKKFSEYLYASKRINENYMLYIKRPKAKDSQETITKREKGFLTEKELKKYIKSVEYGKVGLGKNQSEEWNIRDKAIIYTFLCTGIRCSALRMIDIDDVDLQNKSLVVTDKGDKVRRYDIPDVLCDAINDWINCRNSLVNDSELKALFISQQRNRMNQGTIYKLVKYYAEDIIEGKNITPHKLRATYGTQLYNKTGDIYFVQKCMGHSDPRTTELYIREKHQNTKRAGDIMEKLF